MIINKNITIIKIREIKKSKTKVKDIYLYYLNKTQYLYETKICDLVNIFKWFSFNIIKDLFILKQI